MEPRTNVLFSSLQMETLREKVEHHNRELNALQARMLRSDADEKKSLSRIDALSSGAQAKALLKQAFPQLVALKATAQSSHRTESASTQPLSSPFSHLLPHHIAIT